MDQTRYVAAEEIRKQIQSLSEIKDEVVRSTKIVLTSSVNSWNIWIDIENMAVSNKCKGSVEFAEFAKRGALRFKTSLLKYIEMLESELKTDFEAL